MLIMVDVDSTVADLMPAWLAMYNAEYGDSLTPDRIDIWGLHELVKPECGRAIYKYLQDDSLYDDVKPISGALGIITMLRSEGHRIVYASSGVHSSAKFKWLERNGFEPGKFASNYIVVYDKGLLKGDLLVDDRDMNITSFGSHKSILFDQPWNREFDWHRRAKNWVEVSRLIHSI